MTEIQYDKTHPFLASIKDRYRLSQPGSQKSTMHLVLDLKGSGLTYKVGDSIAIFPTNDPDVVDKTLRVTRATGDEIVTDKQGIHSYSYKDYLSTKANLAEVTRKLLNEIYRLQTNQEKKERLEFLLAEGQKEAFKEYQSAHEIWDTLEENQEVPFSPQDLCLMMLPLLPRFYSIASSLTVNPEEVHLTVAELYYETNGHIRHGICTHYLCQLAPLNQPVIPIYIQSSNGFTLPEDHDIPMIMIGPGTGVAPFVGFMKEREAVSAPGKNWLFFGEQHEAFDFFYRDYWHHLVNLEMLRITTAFSRDQEHKIYVQHRLLECSKEIFDLMEQGCIIYVCGDASRMAKDVDAALHQIIRMHAECDEQEAKNYMKNLRTSKRYLRDVY